MLLRYEVAATRRKLAYHGSIEAEDGARLLTQILGKSLELVADAALIERSYALSTEYNLPSSYDAQYLAVAVQNDLVVRFGHLIGVYLIRLTSDVIGYITSQILPYQKCNKDQVIRATDPNSRNIEQMKWQM